MKNYKIVKKITILSVLVYYMISEKPIVHAKCKCTYSLLHTGFTLEFSEVHF